MISEVDLLFEQLSIAVSDTPCDREFEILDRLRRLSDEAVESQTQQIQAKWQANDVKRQLAPPGAELPQLDLEDGELRNFLAQLPLMRVETERLRTLLIALLEADDDDEEARVNLRNHNLATVIDALAARPAEVQAMPVLTRVRLAMALTADCTVNDPDIGWFQLLQLAEDSMVQDLVPHFNDVNTEAPTTIGNVRRQAAASMNRNQSDPTAVLTSHLKEFERKVTVNILPNKVVRLVGEVRVDRPLADLRKLVDPRGWTQASKFFRGSSKVPFDDGRAEPGLGESWEGMFEEVVGGVFGMTNMMQIRFDVTDLRAHVSYELAAAHNEFLSRNSGSFSVRRSGIHTDACDVHLVKEVRWKDNAPSLYVRQNWSAFGLREWFERQADEFLSANVAEFFDPAPTDELTPQAYAQIAAQAQVAPEAAPDIPEGNMMAAT